MKRLILAMTVLAGMGLTSCDNKPKTGGADPEKNVNTTSDIKDTMARDNTGTMQNGGTSPNGSSSSGGGTGNGGQ